MHLKRWLTGVIALPILILLIGPGPGNVYCSVSFYILLYLVNCVGLNEYYAIAPLSLPRFLHWTGHFLSLLLFAVVYMRHVLLIPAIIALMAMVPMTFFMLTYTSPNSQRTSQLGIAVMGPVYIGVPLVLLLHIHQYYPHGNMWIFFLLGVIFATDTGAFYVGRLFGKHRLHKAVSPGKTWEGTMGGLISGVIVAIFFLKITGIQKLDPMTYGLAFLLPMAGQIGDLAESMLKRDHGVKDSGRILPGHGGILDRIDALLFAIPLLYVYLSFRLP